jgi:hypothetical protein
LLHALQRSVGHAGARPLLLFLYGAEFSPSVPIFQAIIWDLPLLMFCSFCGNMTTVVGWKCCRTHLWHQRAANVVFNAR